MGTGSVKKIAKLLVPTVFILVLVVVWSFRALVLSTVLQHFVAPFLQSQVSGLTVQFGSVETNLISRLRLNQLSVDYCHDGACLSSRIPSVHLSYSLAGIFPWRGWYSLAPQLAINLESPSLTGTLPAAESSPSAKLELPVLPILPALQVKNCSLDIKVPGQGTISGHGISLLAPFYLPHGKIPYALTFDAEHLAVEGSGLPRQEGPAAFTLRYRPGRLEVPELIFAGSTLLKDGLLEIDDQDVRFATELRLLGSKGKVEGSIEQQMAKVSFHLAEGDVEELAGAAGVEPPVSGQLKAEGEMTMTVGRPETLVGAVKASIRNGVWDGAAIDDFEVSGRATEQKIYVDTLSLTVNGSQLTLHDGEAPIVEFGETPWLEVLSASRATVQMRVVDIDTLPPSWSAPLLAHWQALGLKEMAVDASLEAATIRVAKAKVSGKAGQLLVKDGVLDLSDGVTDWLAVPWSAQWQAELSDSAVIQYFWEDWPATGGTVTGQGNFSGTLSEPQLPCKVTITGASLRGVQLAKVSGQLTWTKDRLALDVMAANREEDHLTWRGTIDLDQGGLLATTVSATFGDLTHYLPQDLASDFQLSGPFTGTAVLSGEFSRLKGDVKASGDWMINGMKLSGAAVDIALAGEALTVRTVSGRINDSVDFDGGGKLTPGAGWQTVKIGLDTLDLSFLGQDLSLQRPGSMTVAGDTITVGTAFEFNGDLGAFRLIGALGGKGRLSLVGDGVRDTGLVSQLWDKDIGFERIDFTIELSGRLSQPEWQGQGTIQKLAVAGAPLALSGRFDLASNPQGLLIKQFELGDNGQSVTLTGRLPLSLDKGGLSLLPHPLSVKGRVVMPEAGVLPRLFPEWLAESGAVEADIDLTGTWDHPQGQIKLDASGLKPGTRLLAAPPGPFTVHGLIDVVEDRLTLSTLELASPGFSVQTSGSISQISLAGLVGLQPEESGSGEITLTGQYSMANLSWLAGKISGVRRIGGSASGSFAVQGQLVQPEVWVDITVKNGEARGTDSLLVARGIDLHASLEHDQLTILTLSGTLGGAQVQGSGTIRGVSSPAPEFDVRMTGKDLLLYRAEGVKIRADSSLVLGGTLQSPQLSGEVLLTDSRVTKNVNWLALLKPGARTGGNESITLFSFVDPPLSDTRFNVRIKGAQPLVIKNNVFKGDLLPNLTLAGTGELPYLTGVIYADSGRITLPSGRLDLERGVIRFSEDSPDRPLLEVQSSGRMMGYDITALVKGVYDEPEVTLSSSPPLSNEDLLMLLLAGRQPVNGGGASGMSSVAVYFGRGLLSRLLAGEDDEFILLEKLEVDVGRAVSLQGEPTVDARFKLADMKWKRDATIYLTGEKDVWDYYNAGLRVVFRFQ